MVYILKELLLGFILRINKGIWKFNLKDKNNEIFE